MELDIDLNGAIRMTVEFLPGRTVRRSGQYRGFYLDLDKVPGSLPISAWFADASRGTARLKLTDADPVMIAALKSARMPIAIPFGGKL